MKIEGGQLHYFSFENSCWLRHIWHQLISEWKTENEVKESECEKSVLAWYVELFFPSFFSFSCRDPFVKTRAVHWGCQPFSLRPYHKQRGLSSRAVRAVKWSNTEKFIKNIFFCPLWCFSVVRAGRLFKKWEAWQQLPYGGEQSASPLPLLSFMNASSEYYIHSS